MEHSIPRLTQSLYCEDISVYWGYPTALGALYVWMLRVFKASGEEVFAIGFEEFMAAVASETEQPDTARALRCYVQRVSGQSRFKQRLLLLDGQMLPDDFVFKGPTDVQLVLQPFEASSEDQIRHLRDATVDNDIQAMEQLLQRPQDPDLEVEGQAPALHYACARGITDAARLLLEADADKDRPYADIGTTPLLMASVHGRKEVVGLLLEANADKDKSDNDGETPLFLASQEGHLEVARLLLEANADKDKGNKNGATPLLVASQEGHLELVRLLLEANADKDKQHSNGATPLFMASRNDHVGVTRLLLEANADKDEAKNDGETPLFTASLEGNLEVVRLLLDAKADKDKAKNDGTTPLLVASQGGHLEVAQLLLELDTAKDKTNS